MRSSQVQQLPRVLACVAGLLVLVARPQQATAGALYHVATDFAVQSPNDQQENYFGFRVDSLDPVSYTLVRVVSFPVRPDIGAETVNIASSKPGQLAVATHLSMHSGTSDTSTIAATPGAAAGFNFDDVLPTPTNGGPTHQDISMTLMLPLHGVVRFFEMPEGNANASIGFFVAVHFFQVDSPLPRTDVSGRAQFSRQGTDINLTFTSSGALSDLNVTALDNGVFLLDGTVITSVTATTGLRAHLGAYISIGNSTVLWDPGQYLENAADFTHTFGFPASGPVFNLPDGFTVNSQEANIVDNQWLGVPEPSSLMLAACGFLGMVAWGWRRGMRWQLDHRRRVVTITTIPSLDRFQVQSKGESSANRLSPNQQGSAA